MFLLSRLFMFLTKSADERAKERSDAYLSDASDLYDLEFRMRKLDREAAEGPARRRAAIEFATLARREEPSGVSTVRL